MLLTCRNHHRWRCVDGVSSVFTGYNDNEAIKRSRRRRRRRNDGDTLCAPFPHLVIYFYYSSSRRQTVAGRREKTKRDEREKMICFVPHSRLLPSAATAHGRFESMIHRWTANRHSSPIYKNNNNNSDGSRFTSRFLFFFLVVDALNCTARLLFPWRVPPNSLIYLHVRCVYTCRETRDVRLHAHNVREQLKKEAGRQTDMRVAQRRRRIDTALCLRAVLLLR